VRWVWGAVPIVLAGSLWPAQAEVIPLPRPKPRPPATADLLSVPIPVPRPKPLARTAIGPAPSTAVPDGLGPLKAGAAGEIDVSLQDIGRERDPETSRDLVPGTASRWTTADIREAADRCTFVLAATNIDAEPEEPVGGPDGCGIAAPVKVAAFGAAVVKPGATLNCSMALAVYKWMTDVVQPAAREYFGEPVVQVRNAASYHCRRRNSSGGGRISEHSFGNAFDISAFVLASGRSITVEGDWSTLGSFFGLNDRASFLKTIHTGACESFATVMGPRANALHENHFHIDLGRGGHYKYCR